MIKKVYYLLFFLLVCCCCPLVSITADTVTDSLQNELNHIHTLSADFSQTIIDQQGEVLKQSTGRLKIKRPAGFYWALESSAARDQSHSSVADLEQLVVSNHDRLLIYNPALKQVIIYNKLNRHIQQTPLLLLFAKQINLTDYFKISRQGQGHYLLVPRQPTADGFKSIALWFNNGKISRMSLQTLVGQTAVTDFSAVKLNLPLADQLFDFTPPSDVDVINQQ